MSAKSYSRYSTHKQCGAKYKFQYIDKYPTPERSGPQAERGTNMHKMVEDIVNEVVDEPSEEFSNLKPYVPFLHGLRGKATPELEFYLNEDWEACHKSEAWIRGFIDMIVPASADNWIYVHEWKSGKEYDDHVFQRHFYSTVAMALFPEPVGVHCMGVYLDQGRNVTNTYERSMERTYRYLWKNRMDALDVEESWVPNPGFQCRWCPFSRDKGGPCRFSGN